MSSKELSEFGHRLEAALAETSTNLTELESRTGIAQSRFSKWKYNKGWPDFVECVAISRGLGLSRFYFLTREMALAVIEAGSNLDDLNDPVLLHVLGLESEPDAATADTLRRLRNQMALQMYGRPWVELDLLTQQRLMGKADQCDPS